MTTTSWTVKYKCPGDWFFKTLKRVKSDTFIDITNNKIRTFMTEENVRIDLPADAVVIFSKERFQAILENAEKEAAQKLAVEK